MALHPGSRRESVTSTNEGRKEDATSSAIAMLQDSMNALEAKEEQLMETKKLHAKEVAELKDEIAHLIDMRKSEQDDFARLLGDTEEDLRTQLEAKSLELTTEQDLRQKDATSFNEERQRLQTKLEDVQRQATSLNEERQQLQTKLEDVQRQATSFNEERQQLQTKLEDVQRQVQQKDRDYTQQLASEREKTKDAEQRCVKLQADFDQQVKALSEEGHARELSAANVEQNLRSQCDELKGQARDLSDELQGTKQKLTSTEGELRRRTSELDNERLRVAEEKSEWESRYASLLRQCESLTAERSQLTSEIEELTEHAGLLRDEAQQQRQEMEDAYGSVTSVLENEREEAKKEAEASKLQIQQLRADHELLMQDKEELSRAFDAMKEDSEKASRQMQEEQAVTVARLRQQHEEASRQMQEEQAAAAARLQQQHTEELEAVRAEMARQTEEFQAEKQQLRQNEANVLQLHNDLSGKYSQLEAQLEHAREEASNNIQAKDAALEKTAQTARDQQAQLEQKLQEKQSELDRSRSDFEAQLAQLQKEHDGLQRQHSELQQGHASLQTEHQQLQANHADAVQEREKVASDFDEFRREMVQKLRDKDDNLSTTVGDLRADAEKSAAAKQAEIDRLTADFERQRQQQMSEHSQLLERHSALEATLSQQRAEIEGRDRRATQEADEHQKRLSDVLLEREGAEQERQLLQRQLDHLRTQMDEALKQKEHEHNTSAANLERLRREELEQARSELERAQHVTQERQAELLRQSEDFESRVRQLQEHQADLEARHGTLQDNHERLAREREAVGRDFDGFRAEAAEKLRAREEELAKQLQDQASEQSAQASDFAAHRAKLEQQCGDLQQRLERLHAEHTGAVEERARLQEEFDSFRDSSAQKLQASQDQLMKTASELQEEMTQQQKAQQVEHSRQREEWTAAQAELKTASAAELERKQGEFDAERKRMEQSRAELEQRVADLSRDKAQLSSDIEEVQGKASELRRGAEQQHEQMAEAHRGVVGGLQSDLERERQQREQVEQARAALEEALRAKEEAARLLETKFERSTAELNEVAATLRQRDQELGDRSAEVSSHVAELQDLRQRHAEAEAESERRRLDLEQGRAGSALELSSKDAELAKLRDEAGRLQAREEELARQVEAKAAEHGQVSAQLHERGQELADRTAESQAQKAELEDLRQKHAALEEAREGAEADRAALHREKEALQEQLNQRAATAAAEAERLEADKAQLSSLLEDVQAECDRKLDEENMQSSSRISQLAEDFEKQLAAKEEKIASLHRDLESQAKAVEQEKAELLSKLADVEVAYEQKLATQEERSNYSMAELKSEFKQEALHQRALHDEELARLTDRLQQQEAGLVAKDKEAAERMSKLQEERDQMSRRLEERLQSREDEFRRQAEEAQAQAQRLAEDLDRAQDQAQRLAADKINLLSEMAQAQADADQLLCDTKASFETRLGDRSKALAEMEEAHGKVEALHKSCIGELQAAHADYSERLQAKDRELADKRAQIKTLGTDVAEQEAKIEHLQVEVEQYQQTHIETEHTMAEMKSGYERRIAQMEEDLSKADKALRNLRDSLDQMEKEKDQLIFDKDQLRETIDHEKKEMSRKTQAFFKECEQKMQENDSKVSQTMAEFNTQRSRLSEEKAEMNRRMEAYRRDCENKMKQDEEEMKERMESFHADCNKRMKEEQETMARRMAELHNKAHEQVAKEQQAAERRVAEIRAQTEEQLKSEREVSDSVRHVLRELPPLQAAMELGDMASLDLELSKWRGEVLSARFGDCRGVVEAVVNMAKERLLTWRGVDHTWKEVIREVERMPSSLSSLTNQCQRLFRAMKEAQLTKMDLRRSDPTSVDRALEVLLAWKDKAMVSHNSVQTLIVQKVMRCHQLGPFDFTDLDICLRLVDRPEDGVHQVFLSRAKVLVEDEKVAPKDLKGLLAHIETMLFFLKYAKSEDLALTHKEFKKQTYPLHPAVSSYLDWAESMYRPGRELVDLSRSHSLMDGTDVTAVLQAMRNPQDGAAAGLNMFREIFYQWAVAMRKQFNLLVLPHHTQVVCLLAFQRFLEAPAASRDHIHALIAQVGTGEGKSMIVAALAIYVVVALRKKVHVVVDDETLLERDFASFRRLFDSFLVEDAGKRRPLKSMLCVSEERLASSKGAPGLAARVDADADICYCEAKHVQSFYASIARNEQGKRDFDSYAGRVLILDEVDALVIDEEPNEPFVYPNSELSEMATAVASGLLSGKRPDQLAHLRSSGHPAANRVFHEVCKEWERGRKIISGEDYVYSKESGRYCALHAGRANPKAWSLALECRNFQDGLSKEIFYQERLFVMSRPRVFRRYHRILGLSGSIGSEPERRFLQETYRAAFFEVPPFLKTCKGSPFHEPLPAQLGDKRAPVYVEETAEAQTQRIAEVAFEARERVPVLIIAKDRIHADQLVESLRLAARSRGLGATCEDAVRSLSRTLYEAEPEQWKENLNRATMPLGGGGGSGRNKTWRVTVTDRRGGRGTDYRVDDSEVDGAGGLLLIPSVVPTSQREWIQFLGRTARQDRRGQYCAVLCAKDYVAHTSKFRETMPIGGCGLDPVKMVLSWGDRETAERIKGSAALYNCGVRVNELCEEVFGKRSELLKDPQARERLVDVCQRLRWLSVREIDEAFARLPSVVPREVPTEARDLGRPEAPPSGGSMLLPVPTQGAGAVNVVSGGGGPKVVIFCLDWSASMKSNDTRTQYNRFQTCVQCILRILRDQVRDTDLVGVVCFGPTVQTIIPPTPKGVGGRMLQTRIASLQPATAGGTCFYDAVFECLRMLGQPNLVPSEALRWLVCLTDGDDLGSSRPNQRGQLVSQMLGSSSAPAGLNMVMITVGALKSENVQVIQSWVKQVTTQGGQGVHLGDKDATGIAKAFEVVAEFLAAEVGGATEC